MKTDSKRTARELSDRLLKLAGECANLRADEVLDSILHPAWAADKSWNWELYIPKVLVEIWPALSCDAKLATFIMAMERHREPNP